MKALLCGLALACAPAWSQCAASVTAQAGQVVVTTRDQQTKTIAGGKADRDPSLSADGNQVVFLRDSGIWTAKCANGWRPEKLLDAPIKTAKAREVSKFRGPQFSPPGDAVFVLAEDYSRSSPGLFAIPTRDAKPRFVTRAMRYWVIHGGPYKGDLVLQQNPPLVVGGHVELYYRYSPLGKRRELVGLMENEVLDFLKHQDQQK